jgi:hypothetical protein
MFNVLPPIHTVLIGSNLSRYICIYAKLSQLVRIEGSSITEISINSNLRYKIKYFWEMEILRPIVREARYHQSTNLVAMMKHVCM